MGASHRAFTDRTAPLRCATLAAALAVGACGGTPEQAESPDYLARAERKADGHMGVTAVVLSPLESETIFGLPLARKKIQPIWLEIDNREDRELYLMVPGIDPDYFAPSEVAWQFKSYGSEPLDEQADRLLDMQIPVAIPPNHVVSGYAYTNLDPGAKAFAVEPFGESMFRSVEFVQLVPGFEADFQRVDFHELYRDDEIQELSPVELPAYLERLPCCVAGGDRKIPGDPLNLVIVGDARQALATPVSHRYLLGRPQDVALQKARGTVDERHHLRLWLAPVVVEGMNVWIGQISRDIGVMISTKTFVTHKIDPVVDEARLYDTLDLAASQSLRSVGYVKGVGASSRSAELTTMAVRTESRPNQRSSARPSPDERASRRWSISR